MQRFTIFCLIVYVQVSCISIEPYKNQLYHSEAIENILRSGKFSDERIEKREGSLYTIKTELSRRSINLDVFVKPTDSLSKDGLRDEIPPMMENNCAQASYEVNKIIGLINTPEHHIRDKAPISNKIEDFGEAGIQVWLINSRKPTRSEMNEIMVKHEPIKEIEELAIFDCLVGNLDRNKSNLLINTSMGKNERMLIGIDHSLTFPSYYDPSSKSDGKKLLIKSFLESNKKGEISNDNLLKLIYLKNNIKKLKRRLSHLISKESIDAFETRLNKLIDTKKVFYP